MITFINNSTNTGDMMCFQQDPNISASGVFSLAWFAKSAHPNTHIDFSWEIDYSFVWAETGQLKPGVIFNASQTVATDPYGDNNQITLTYTDEAYDFIDQTQGSPTGSLYIKENNTIPLKQASVGIGMSGTGTFVVDAQPNYNETFTPHPTYWVAFGSYKTGEVLDIQSVTNTAEVSFPAGITHMYAILNEDNTWTITTSEGAVNSLVKTLARRKLA